VILIITVVAVGIILISPIVYIYIQKELRRQVDQIITGERNCSVHKIDRCITALEELSKPHSEKELRRQSGLGFHRWKFEQDRWRVERLRIIRDKTVNQSAL